MTGSEPLVTNAADETQLEEAAKQEVINEHSDTDDLWSILEAPQGRRFYIRMLREFGLFKTPFSPLGDAHTYHAIGLSDAARWLIDQARQSHPTALVTLLQEYNAGSNAGRTRGRKRKR